MIGLSLHEQLKEATKNRHQQLEEELDLERRVYSRGAYADLLARFFGIYSPLEEALLRAPDLHDFGYRMAERSKLDALRADLAILGITADYLPWCTKLPVLRTIPQLLGCAYVMEGATLGGMAIQSMAQKARTSLPSSFFSVYGATTRERWAEFLGILKSCHRRFPDQDEEVIEAALDTFQAFESWCA